MATGATTGAPGATAEATRSPSADEGQAGPGRAPGNGAAEDSAVTRVEDDASRLPITMLADRVLVRVSQADGERRSRAGIVIPATAQVSRRLSWAEAVAVGPHVRAVKTGDAVLFNPDDRFEVEVHGEEFVILRERDIHAVAATRIDGGTGLYL